MNEPSFIKGRDVTVKRNNRILSGVTELKRITDTNARYIREFLNPEPVEAVLFPIYTVELTMDVSSDNLFDSLSGHEISVIDGERTEIYYDCRVKEKACVTSPEGYESLRIRFESERKGILI